MSGLVNGPLDEQRDAALERAAVAASLETRR